MFFIVHKNGSKFRLLKVCDPTIFCFRNEASVVSTQASRKCERKRNFASQTPDKPFVIRSARKTCAKSFYRNRRTACLALGKIVPKDYAYLFAFTCCNLLWISSTDAISIERRHDCRCPKLITDCSFVTVWLVTAPKEKKIPANPVYPSWAFDLLMNIYGFEVSRCDTFFPFLPLFILRVNRKLVKITNSGNWVNRTESN